MTEGKKWKEEKNTIIEEHSKQTNETKQNKTKNKNSISWNERMWKKICSFVALFSVFPYFVVWSLKNGDDKNWK